MKTLYPHPVSTLLRRTLLTIRSQLSSRQLGRESTSQGGTSIVVISYKKVIQRDHFRAIMVDLEPTVVDEVGLKLFFKKNYLFSCVTTFFSAPRWELVLIANSSTQASWSPGRRWPVGKVPILIVCPGRCQQLCKGALHCGKGADWGLLFLISISYHTTTATLV